MSFASRWRVLPILLLCLTLFIGVGNAWGTDATFTPTSTSGGTLSNAPSAAADSFSNTYTNNNASGYQMTENNKQTLTLSGFAGCTINGVTVHVKTNGSSGNCSGYLQL